ncbi:MAG: transglutaminase-like domain-containing protein [Pirellulales bacterium]
MSRTFLFLLALAFLFALRPATVAAQFDRVKKGEVGKPNQDAAPPPENGVRLDEHRVQKWKIGVVIKAPGNCSGVFCTVPVPTDWPEQKVKIVSEEISPQVKNVQFRVLDGGVRQMLIDIPQIKAGETVTALLTYEVDRSSIRPPLDPAIFQLPNTAKLPKEVRMYLAPSPLIESTHPTLAKLAKEVLAGKEDADAWTKVETIYDWVREHVEYFEGPIKGALAAYKDKRGDCEELTSLFIALCRANKIPARTVWVPDHCYPEFYLVDDQGRGHWIPCQAAGTRNFGGIPEFRPVLQKGDNFKVPERKDAVRYVPELVKAKNVAANPQVETVRQLLAE